MSAQLLKFACFVTTVAAVWFEESAPILGWTHPETTKLDGFTLLPLATVNVNGGVIYNNWGWMGEAYVESGEK